jgi:Zn-dependent M28 family amino/carboxypeptidase
MTFPALLLTSALAQAPAVDATLDDLRRLTIAESNDARFEAMTAMLRARNIPFTIERFTLDRPPGREPRTEGRNIVASFGSGAEAIVAGAHYDAVRLEDSTLSHGAVDNAGSCVVLLQLAEALKAQAPARRVTLVWFDMEELGLVGSAKYVETHRADRIAAMVNLDVNAYGDTVIFGSSRGAENAAVRKALYETCAERDTSCIGFAQMPPGDDRSFVKAGIPSVSMAILPAIEAHQLWLMMSAGRGGGASTSVPAVMNTIHTSHDVIEKVDPVAVSRVADFAQSLIRRLIVLPR